MRCKNCHFEFKASENNRTCPKCGKSHRKNKVIE